MFGFIGSQFKVALSIAWTGYSDCCRYISHHGCVLPDNFLSKISSFFYSVALPYKSSLQGKIQVIHSGAGVTTVRKLSAFSDVIQLSKRVKFSAEEAAALLKAIEKIDGDIIESLSQEVRIASLPETLPGLNPLPATFSSFQKKILIHLTNGNEASAQKIIDGIHHYLLSKPEYSLEYSLPLASISYYNADSTKALEAVDQLMTLLEAHDANERLIRLHLKGFFARFIREYRDETACYQRVKLYIGRLKATSE